MSGRGASLERPEVAAVLRTCGVVPVRVAGLLPADPWRPFPRSFVVEDRSGRRVKLRLGQRDQADRAARLTAALDDARLPPPLAVCGAASAWAWVEGPTLDNSPRGADLDLAAELLAWLHTQGVARLGRRALVRSTRRLAALAARQLDELVGAGVVGARLAQGLAALLRGLPPTAPWAVVHGDFCGENLVRAAAHTIVSIDHEWLGWGFVDHDLARAWSRWPLGPASERRLLEHYARLRPLPPKDVMHAWRAVAVVKRLHLRFRHGASVRAATERAEQLVGLR